MNTQQKPQKRTGFFDIIKNLFWLLLFLQFAPIFFSGLKKNLEEAIAPKTQVGYLQITGLITDSSYYVKQIRKFTKSPQIKGLILKIDSSGGLPGSAQAIFKELQKFKEKKPVVSFIENVGASGAYNIAVGSNHIVASPSALIGSIGVWMQIPPNIKHLADDWKIQFRTIKTGNFKTAGSPFKDMTPEENKHLQEVSDDSYNQFIEDIAKQRNLSVQDHKIWADGKIFTGNQSLALKLIDQIGSEQDAIDELKKQALIDKEEEIKLIKPKQPSRFMRLFSGEDDTDENTSYSSFVASFITQVLQKVSINLSTGA